MKLRFIILLLPFIGLSQSNKDSVILELSRLSTETTITLTKTKDSLDKKFIAYRLCSTWIDKVNYLKSSLSIEELEMLKNDENATLNAISIITSLERNNTKVFARKTLENLLQNEIKFMSQGCSDAVSTITLSEYILYALTKQNPYFKPNFRFRKREVKKFENRIKNKEYLFWYSS
jgi:hypothetical protein